jgi:type I restriction enzyme S subunit
VSWPLVNLDSICRPRQWKTIASSKLHDEGYTVYGANGKIGFYSEYTHENPTIMITCRGATCGNVNISEPKSYINGNAMALDEINPKEIDINYLKYCLVDRGFRDVISGSAQPQITGQGLSKVIIPLPPLETQKQIAAVLEKADQLRKDCKQMEQELNSLAQSVFIDMFGDPVTNPKGWEKGTIRQLLSSANYGTSEKSSTEILQYPVLRMNNITYEGGWNFKSLKYMDMSRKDEEKYLVESGDILFNRTNSKELVGKTAVYREDKPMAYAGYLVRARCNELGNPDYISAFMNSKYGKQTLQFMCKSIVGMANINAQEFQKIEIAKPPVELQNEFSGRVSEIQNLVREVNEQEAEYNDAFNSLMQKAFKGELSLKSTKKVA